MFVFHSVALQRLGVFVAPDGKCKYSAPSAEAYGKTIGVPLPDVSELKRLSDDKTQKKKTTHLEKNVDHHALVEVSKPIKAAQASEQVKGESMFSKVPP